ncbi:MAG: hypothetical protein Q7S57_00360 [bacterium]|nr:hypothetical protein [bacterium]
MVEFTWIVVVVVLLYVGIDSFRKSRSKNISQEERKKASNYLTKILVLVALAFVAILITFVIIYGGDSFLLKI